MSENKAIFSDEETSFGDANPVLGAEYERARRVAGSIVNAFSAKYFEPMIKEFSEKLYSELLNSTDVFFESDVESNLQSEIWHATSSVVRALLSGEKWALNKYPLNKSHDGEKIRACIFKEHKDELIGLRVVELEAENERLEKIIASYRDRS